MFIIRIRVECILITTLSTRSSKLDPYVKLARWIARSQDPFVYFFLVFEAGNPADGDDAEMVDEDERNM
jgi:hypothetical protein